MLTCRVHPLILKPSSSLAVSRIQHLVPLPLPLYPQKPFSHGCYALGSSLAILLMPTWKSIRRVIQGLDESERPSLHEVQALSYQPTAILPGQQVSRLGPLSSALGSLLPPRFITCPNPSVWLMPRKIRPLAGHRPWHLCNSVADQSHLSGAKVLQPSLSGDSYFTTP